MKFVPVFVLLKINIENKFLYFKHCPSKLERETGFPNQS